jgi:hypothetical protein
VARILCLWIYFSIGYNHHILFLSLNNIAIPSIARPICVSCELCALRLCGDLGICLRPGLAKREGGHEIAEMMGVAMPHCLSSTVHYISQLHDLNPFSYQNHFVGVVLVSICTVLYMVHCVCIDVLVSICTVSYQILSLIKSFLLSKPLRRSYMYYPLRVSLC